jgi:hypothetical protein
LRNDVPPFRDIVLDKFVQLLGTATDRYQTLFIQFFDNFGRAKNFIYCRIVAGDDIGRFPSGASKAYQSSTSAPPSNGNCSIASLNATFSSIATLLRIERGADARFRALDRQHPAIADAMLNVKGAAMQCGDTRLNGELVTPPCRREKLAFVFNDGDTIDSKLAHQCLQTQATACEQSMYRQIEPDEVVRVEDNAGWITVAEFD